MAALRVSKVTLEIPLFPFIEESLFLFRVNLTFFSSSMHLSFLIYD